MMIGDKLRDEDKKVKMPNPNEMIDQDLEIKRSIKITKIRRRKEKDLDHNHLIGRVKMSMTQRNDLYHAFEFINT